MAILPGSLGPLTDAHTPRQHKQVFFDPVLPPEATASRAAFEERQCTHLEFLHAASGRGALLMAALSSDGVELAGGSAPQEHAVRGLILVGFPALGVPALKHVAGGGVRTEEFDPPSFCPAHQ